MIDESKKYLNELIPNNWFIVTYDGYLVIYLNYNWSTNPDSPDVKESLKKHNIPYFSANLFTLDVDIKDLINHKIKVREDKINSILNE